MILFETQRLIIQHYTSADEENFFLLNGNEQVVKYIRPAQTKEESDAFLKKNINFYNTYPNLGRWAAIEKETGIFIGSFALIPLKENEIDKIQIGYALLPNFWNKGFATEMVKYGTVLFFSKHKDNCLYAITETPNTPSQKVLLKCGYKLDDVYLENDKELTRFILQRKDFISSSFFIT